MTKPAWRRFPSPLPLLLASRRDDGLHCEATLLLRLSRARIFEFEHTVSENR